MKSRKLEFKTLELVIILLAVSIFSTLSGCLVGFKLKDNEEKNKYTEVDEDLQNFINEYNDIKDNFYGNFDSDKLLTNAISAIILSLEDDYSGLMDLESSASDSVKLNGIYTGIGVEIYNNENYSIIVNNVYKDTLAYKAGIRANDKIIKFNDENVEGLYTSELTAKIKETNGEQFNLTLLRDGKEFTVTLKIETIILKSVESEIMNNVGYINISIFANNTAAQLKETLNNLEKSNVEGIIIDLRDNPGGYLSVATEMADLFLDSDKIIYKTKDNDVIESYYSKGDKDYDKKIVILINNNSASASELLAAALKENLNVTIVGETSFGKGTIQAVKEFNGTQYKYTTKLWLTPSGKSINETGITPDIKVELKKDSDNQLQKALEQFN